MSIDLLANSLKDLQRRIADLEDQLAPAAEQVRADARAEVTERLNNAVRRLRQSETPEAWFLTLVETTAQFAGRVTAFSIHGPAIRHEGNPRMEVPLSSAAALANAVESRDVVIAAATARELSPEFFEFLGSPAGARVWLFPLIGGGGKVNGVLYAQPGDCAVDVSAIELLCSIAVTPPEPEPDQPAPAPPETVQTDLIRIAGVVQKAKLPGAERPGWGDLSAAEQQIHMRAQRFARNTVANLILHHHDKVQLGRASEDLYTTLREEIDAARDNFRRQFARSCPSMVDYLHLELVRTLAKGDAVALGDEYPGPLR
jgi:hypothetical protein